MGVCDRHKSQEEKGECSPVGWVHLFTGNRCLWRDCSRSYSFSQSPSLPLPLFFPPYLQGAWDIANSCLNVDLFMPLF